MAREMDDLVDRSWQGLSKEEVLERVKEAVNSYNPARMQGTRLAIIQYDRVEDGVPTIHGFVYRSGEEARRVAVELERDKIAKVGAQVSYVTII
jgi:hypothetical protein